MLPLPTGHELGRRKVEELVEYAQELGIKELTFYALSVENIKNRPKKELTYLFKIFQQAFLDLDTNKIMDNNIQIRFVGDLELLPLALRTQCTEIMNKTKHNNKFFVNFAIAYDGRQEIVNAVKNIIDKKIKSEMIDERIIAENLYLTSEPDIIIRTGGEKRTSNFLPWQSAYSEWFFLDKMWPEFEKNDLIACINEFKNRKRNFGA